MANTITSITPKLMARAMLALRQRCIMPQLVNSDYSTEAKKKSATIDVPFSSAIAATDVTPGSTPVTAADSTPTTVPITLDSWKKTNFFLTDKEMGEIDARAGYLPMQVSEAVKGLANAINISIFAKYVKVYAHVAAASAGNAMATDSDPRNVRAKLNTNLCPLDDRRFVLDFSAEANALGLTSFRDASQSTDAGPILRGEIGTKYGFRFFSDNHVPTHTAGTITTGLTAKAATVVAVGATSFVARTAASTGACALVVGDLITIGADPTQYVLTQAATQPTANTDVTLRISPPLAVALAGGENITVVASHVVNLAFNRDAFAFAMRPLQDLEIQGLGNVITTVQDPVSGLILRLEVSRQNKQTVWEFDALWGVELIQPAFACRLRG